MLLSVFVLLCIVMTSCGHEHFYGEWVTVKAPTCTEAGLEERTCACGQKESGVVSAIGHKASADATCTEDCVCTVCGAILQSANGHLPSNSATCTTAQTCLVCKIELQTALGHMPGIEATCTTAQNCTVCNAELKAALGHKPSGEWEVVTNATESTNGLKIKKCSVCGEKASEAILVASKGLSFTSNGNGTCYVSGIGHCIDTSIVIPSAYNGMQVTGIGASAFANHFRLRSITIPNSVRSIEEGAFAYCDGLRNIEIPNSVTYIGASAFKNCYQLNNIEIPNSVTSIGDYAFYTCNGLKSITIPASVTIVGDFAFGNCAGLTNIDIPANVTIIGNGAFSGCSGVTSIMVDSNNPNYVSIDGVLFNKAITNLICYPAGKTGSYTIFDSVTSIGDSAFENCDGLTSVTISDGVTTIGNSAFSRCDSLTSITFNGTKAQWNAISKDSDWTYNVPATEVVCSDGEVSI